RGLLRPGGGLREGNLAHGERCLVVDQATVIAFERGVGLVESLLRGGELGRAVLGCGPLRSLVIGGLRLLEPRRRFHVATGDDQQRQRRDCSEPLHWPPPVPLRSFCAESSLALASSASARVACSRVTDLASSASAWALSSLRAATCGSSLLSLFAA